MAMQSDYRLTEGVQTATNRLVLLVDCDDTSAQGAGNGHTIEAWADHNALAAGTNLFIAEVVSNVVSFYSSAAVTKNLGTTGNRWSTVYGVNADLSGTLTLSPITATYVLYAGVGGLVSGDAGLTFSASTNTLTLGANHIYSQGAHGLTLAADDWAVGSSGTSYVWWENSATRLQVYGHLDVGSTTAGTFGLGDISGGITGSGMFWFDESTEAIYMFNSAGTQRIKIGALSAGDNTNMAVWLGDAGQTPSGTNYAFLGGGGGDTYFNTAAGGRLLFRIANGASIAMIIGSSGQVNLATTVLATANGDFAAGLTAGNQWWMDQSSGILYGRSAAATTGWQIEIATGGTTWFNQQNLDIDFRVDADVNDFAFFVDAGAAAGAGQIRMNVSGVTLGADAAPTANYVADIRGAMRWTTFANGGTATDASATGEWACGLLGAGRVYLNPAGGAAGVSWTLYSDAGTAAVVLNASGGSAGAGWVFNESAHAENDFRVEGGSLAYAIFLDASTATENLALLTTAAPAWNSLDRGIFLGDATTAPTGAPTGGVYLWSEAGVLKYMKGDGSVVEL